MKKLSEFMKLEHEHITMLWDTFIIKKNKKEAKSFFEKFKKSLLLHMQLEDEKISPLFNKYLGIDKGQTTVIKEDHEKLLKLLQKVKDTLDSNNEIESVYNKTHFRRALIKHHDREDTMQYPLFDVFISQEDWEKISHELLKMSK